MSYFTSYLKKVIWLRNSRYPPDTGHKVNYIFKNVLFLREKIPCATGSVNDCVSVQRLVPERRTDLQRRVSWAEPIQTTDPAADWWPWPSLHTWYRLRTACTRAGTAGSHTAPRHRRKQWKKGEHCVDGGHAPQGIEFKDICFTFGSAFPPLNNKSQLREKKWELRESENWEKKSENWERKKWELRKKRENWEKKVRIERKKSQIWEKKVRFEKEKKVRFEKKKVRFERKKSQIWEEKKSQI